MEKWLVRISRYRYISAMTDERNQHFMKLAIEEAKSAFDKGEVPVGAVVVFENNVIGRGHNLVESMRDATAHAEMVALSAAFAHFGDWRLEHCHLFCTLEPCSMCAGAAVLSRIESITYGAKDPKFGACGSIFSIPTERKLNHRIELKSGWCENEISELMKLFFRQARMKNTEVN